MSGEIHSTLAPEWREHWRKLDPVHRKAARAAYLRWRSDADYRRKTAKEFATRHHGRIYRVGLGDGYRAAAHRDGNTYEWFFIGTHAE
ncbi:hypothetical protein BH11ARM2_BH11ARM2_24990 [soil metagenome]